MSVIPGWMFFHSISPFLPRAALQISEGIALERESLVKQLNMLRYRIGCVIYTCLISLFDRDMNKKLRDDRDEAELRRVRHSHRPEPSPSSPSMHALLNPSLLEENPL